MVHLRVVRSISALTSSGDFATTGGAFDLTWDDSVLTYNADFSHSIWGSEHHLAMLYLTLSLPVTLDL